MTSTATFALPGFDPERPTRLSASEIGLFRAWLDWADSILVGMGAGLSASGGLDYQNLAFMVSHFPEHAAAGYASAWDAMSSHWDITPQNKNAYWGYMARHIQVMRHEAPLLDPYQSLAALLKGRDYFVFSTNADGQAEKMGVPSSRLYTPQGSYMLFQCALPCRPVLYDATPFLRDMLAALADPDLADPLEVPDDAIPHCPHCGSLLVPNLRKDDTFVNALQQRGKPNYQAFLDRTAGGRLLLLELGVGYNSPGAIRYPFERLASANPNIRFIRLNWEDAVLPPTLGLRALSLQDDISAALRAVIKDG